MENALGGAQNDSSVPTAVECTAVLHLSVEVPFESAMELLPLRFRDLLREMC